MAASDPFRSLNFTNFGWPVPLLLRTFALHEGDPCSLGEVESSLRLMRARAPPLSEMPSSTLGEDEPQPKPVAEYEFDQRIAC